MSQRRASLLERKVADLWCWFDERWRLLVMLLALAVGASGLALLATRALDRPAVEEDAVVVRFGTTPGKEGDRPHVMARMRDGSIVHLPVDYRATLYCRRGSTIRVVRRGSFVSLVGGGCAPSRP